MKNIWSWVGIVILIALLGWAGYYGWQQRSTIEELSNQLGNMANQSANQNDSLQNQIGNNIGNLALPLNNTTNNGTITPVTPTTGWKTYSNSTIGFSFKYPSNWSDVIISRQPINTFFEKGIRYSSSTDTGHRYFDPNKAFTFEIYSQDYQNGLGTVITKKINVNWSATELEANVGTRAMQILFTKKLSSKSMLLGMYASPECSPSIRISVVTPLDVAGFPNLFIYIDKPEFWKDPIVVNYSKSINPEDPSTGDPCDLEPAYREIADKIIQGGYPVLNGYIETARLIADSVVVK
ncbi:MAG: hypothetical protein V1807_02365 [Patescibacteria group bacterium]